MPGLVESRSKRDNSRVYNLDYVSGNGAWISLNDRATEGIYTWDKSSSYYLNWNTGEPNNNKGNEDCVEMGRNGGWQVERPQLWRVKSSNLRNFVPETLLV